ncbi:MAG: flavodoxin family protein, partial [Spirochaetaceae bacterium]|nr:flavodoxin family protein [Spirochaetaceae bacterium]
GKRITVVTDSTDGRLGAIITRLTSTFEDDVEIVDLRKLRIAGGCMGCLQCAPGNICRYGNTDDVMKTYIEKIYPSDVFIMAATIKGRWYSSLMKSFIDRGFFNTHKPFLTDKQVAILLDGDIDSNPALKEGLNGYVEWQGGSLNGIVTTMSGNAAEVDAAAVSLARRIILALEKDYHRPATFLGVGGIKIFRDDIYTNLGIVFQADYKHYRKNGIFKTLPHKKPLRLLMYRIIRLITSFPPINRKMTAGMRDFMLMPYKRVLAKAALTADEAASTAQTPVEKDRSSVA